MFVLFVTHHAPAQGSSAGTAPGEGELARVAEILRAVPNLVRALIHTAAETSDPYLNDGASPPLALQLYFPRIEHLESATGRTGSLQALTAGDVLPSLAGTLVEHQAMAARTYPVPDPYFAVPGEACTYLVHYPGPAEDQNAWFDHYVGHHPPIMARFPGIREIEICSRIEWTSFLPWARVAHMQRNKVVFDDADALRAALNSPVRDEMRRDFHTFPPFKGGSLHFPMRTREVVAAPR